ncbi:YciI family protein [Streptomyces hesseae]|uniref:YciI family protein n=1 Tax=Streptomyces hesseae TaxID=3075519 RepID=A0ABU2SMY3_9ACTN|nr:YciI family protein [Streptomyces sp. DSM 40473]MDT0449145.1 YciI family protein [Streptomyces sp. DSM 40473]
MFVLELTYIAPIERIDAALPEHVAWLEAHYETGVFIASGRKVPRDGGIILAVGLDRAKIEEITRSDPFTVAGVAEYTVTEFIPTKTSQAMEPYRQELPS